MGKKKILDEEKMKAYLKLPLEELKTKIDANNKILDKLWKEDDSKSWEEYCEKCNPYWDDNKYLYTAKSLLLPREEIKMRPLEDWEKDEEWIHITIETFKEWCESGFITSYDGSGYYATETEVSYLPALTYAFHDGYVRDDFTRVCWYNK